jgi:hypothetical protein
VEDEEKMAREEVTCAVGERSGDGEARSRDETKEMGVLRQVETRKAPARKNDARSEVRSASAKEGMRRMPKPRKNDARKGVKSEMAKVARMKTLKVRRSDERNEVRRKLKGQRRRARPKMWRPRQL